MQTMIRTEVHQIIRLINYYKEVLVINSTRLLFPYFSYIFESQGENILICSYNSQWSKTKTILSVSQYL